MKNKLCIELKTSNNFKGSGCDDKKGKEMVFLGVDGGGTNTEFLIADSEGKTLARYKGNASTYHQIGLDSFTKIISNGIETVLSKANLCLNDIKGAALGLGAFGEVKKDELKMRDSIFSILGSIPTHLVNDVVVAWAGALDMKPGINVVSGTGSIAYGRSDAGLEDRCGGWGPEIGDEGSAFWIGQKAISTFSMQSDGRRKKTALYQLIKNHFSISNDFQMVSIRPDLGRRDVAALSEICYQAAQMEDQDAIFIFRKAASKLVEIAYPLVQKLNLDHPVIVSGTGGVFAAKPYLTDAFISELKAKGLCYQSPAMSGVEGAILLDKPAADKRQNEPLIGK